MSNPILEPNMGQQSDNSGIFGLIDRVRNSADPNAAMFSMLSSNPKFQNVMSYINQNGGDARAAFYNLAAQKGVNPEDILKQLR